MKKCPHPLFLFIIFSLLTFSLSAQEKIVRFPNGTFVTGSNVTTQKLRKENLGSSLFGDSYFVLIQFSSLPSEKLQWQLKDAGVELNSYINGNAYLGTIKNT